MDACAAASVVASRRAGSDRGGSRVDTVVCEEQVVTVTNRKRLGVGEAKGGAKRG